MIKTYLILICYFLVAPTSCFSQRRDTISVKSIEEVINLILKDYDKHHPIDSIKKIISIEYHYNMEDIELTKNTYIKAYEYPTTTLKKKEVIILILLKTSIHQGKTYIHYQKAQLKKMSKKKQTITYSSHINSVFVVTN